MTTRGNASTARALLTAAGAMLAFAAASAAEPVYMTYAGSGEHGRDVQVTLGGGMTFADGSKTKSVWAGSNMFSTEQGMFRTWCAEVAGLPDSGWFEAGSVSDAVGGDELGRVRADAIGRLFAATDGGEAATTAEHAAAFQAVLWELVHDFTGVDGDVNASRGTVRIAGIDAALFGFYRNIALHGGDDPRGMLALTSSFWQDQIAMTVVPLPSASGLALAGLGLCAIRRSRPHTPKP